MHLWMEPDPEVSMGESWKLDLAGTGMGNFGLNRSSVAQGFLTWESMKPSLREDLWPLELRRQMKTTKVQLTLSRCVEVTGGRRPDALGVCAVRPLEVHGRLGRPFCSGIFHGYRQRRRARLE